MACAILYLNARFLKEDEDESYTCISSWVSIIEHNTNDQWLINLTAYLAEKIQTVLPSLSVVDKYY